MKNLLFLCFAVALASCTQKPKGADSKIFIEKEVSDFIKVNPDWTKADAATTERFKHKLINLSNEADFLKDFPMQLKTVRDTIINTLPIKLAEFVSFKDENRPKESLLNDLELEVSGIVSEIQLKELKVNQRYLLTGSLYKQGKRGSVDLLEANDNKTYRLGRYTFLISGYKPL